jgi:hypothetical protein
MDKPGIRLKSRKEQRLDAELGLIIDDMGKAMWNANKDYIASSRTELRLTDHMRQALWKYQEYCLEHYGK